MALKIWTAAEPTLIKKTFGQSLKALKPDVPEHQFYEFVEGQVPTLPGPSDVLLICGSKPLEELRRQGLAPKNRTVTSLREKPLKFATGGWGMVTFDPGIIGSEPDKKNIIDWDLRLALRLMATGGLMPELGEYSYVRDFTGVIDYVNKEFDKYGKPVDVTLDLETMGFFPWFPDKDIISISFTAEKRKSHVMYLGPQEHPVQLNDSVDLLGQIEWLLNTDRVKMRGSNLKFDLIWILVKWGLRCTNFKFDNLLAGSLLDENRSNSLNIHAKIMTSMGGYDDPFNAKYDKGKMEAIPAGEDFLTYAGGDTDAADRVADTLRDQLLEDGPLARFYVKILHPAARAFEKVETRGVHVSLDRFENLRTDLSTEIDKAQKTCLELLPNKMRIKYKDRIEEQLAEGKSPLLPSILKEYFFSPAGLNLKPKMKSEKTQQPSLAKAHLRMFKDVPEAVEMVKSLTTMDVASKTRSTFVDGFLAHLRPDGLLHPTYFLAHADFDEADEGDESGTVTGRLSAKNPAFQIIPKKTLWAKRIRECYVAPKGKAILQLDYSQGELRVVACVANEKNMLKAYKEGMDLHCMTGSKLAGVDYETFMTWQEDKDTAWLNAPEDANTLTLAGKFKYMRDRAKPANFGLLYGMGAEGFQAYAWASYSLALTLEEAEKIRDMFFALYPGLPDYHKAQRKLVWEWEEVRSPLGRVRHLPTIKSWDKAVKSTAERQAINSPIQSTLSDMMIWSIARIEDAYPNDEIAIVGMIHDAMIAYVDEDKAELRAKQAKEIMSNLPFHELDWHPQLQFPADAEAGPDLAHLKELKLAA